MTRPFSVSLPTRFEAVMSSRREFLERSREHLTALLAGADERTAPGLSRELRAVLSELEMIPTATGAASLQQQLKDARAKRLSEAADRARTASGQ